MAIWKHPKRKGYWVGEVRVKGRRVTAAGKTRAIVRERLELKVKDAKQRIDTDFMQLCESYLDDCQIRNSKKTYQDKKATIKRLLSHLGSVWPNSHRILEYLQTRTKAISACASNIDHKNLSAMFNWGCKFGFADSNPMVKIDRLPWRQPRKYIPPLQDIRAVLLVAGPYRDLLEVMLYSAARKSQVLKLRWEDIDFDRKTVTFWTRKRQHGNKEAHILSLIDDRGNTTHLYSILLRRFHNRDKRQEWVFPNNSKGSQAGRYTHLYNLMPRLCRQADVLPFGFHALRHFSASSCAERGLDTLTISKLLGHTNVRTTERYLHSLSEAKKRAARVMEGVLKTVDKCAKEQ